MANGSTVSDTIHDEDYDYFTKEEIEDIREYRSGKVKAIEFKTVAEAIRWLHD